MIVTRIDWADRECVNALIVRNWYATQMVVHGEIIDLGGAEGFCAYEGDEIVGLATFRLIGSPVEVHQWQNSANSASNLKQKVRRHSL